MCGYGGIRRDKGVPETGLVEGEGRRKEGCLRHISEVEIEGDEDGFPVQWGCEEEIQTESEGQWG